MGDLIVVAATLFAGLLVAVGLGWLVPRLRRRLAGRRTGFAAGPLPGVGLIAAGLLLGTIALGGFDDGDDAPVSSPGAVSADLAATCSLLDGISGPDDLTVAKLDGLLAAAPDAVAGSVRTVRDRFAAAGPAAFDEPAVGAAFEAVAAFEGEHCAD